MRIVIEIVRRGGATDAVTWWSDRPGDDGDVVAEVCRRAYGILAGALEAGWDAGCVRNLGYRRGPGRRDGR